MRVSVLNNQYVVGVCGRGVVSLCGHGLWSLGVVVGCQVAVCRVGDV